jgi:hypothetical protein
MRNQEAPMEPDLFEIGCYKQGTPTELGLH